MSKLQIAIFGCGRMGTLRAHAVQKWGANVCAVFDTDIKRSRQLAESIAPCRTATIPNEVDWSDFDAIFVCTPPYERGAVREALLHGLPTLMEKPVGLSARKAAELVGLAASRSVPTAVGYMNRYRDSVRLARERLQNQTIIGVAANWVNGIYAVPWWTRPEQSGGSVNEQAAHFIDLIRFLIGDPMSVHATASPHPKHPNVVGNAVLSLSFANGALASLFYSCRADTKVINFRVFTTTEEICLKGWDLDLINPETNQLLSPQTTDRYSIFDIETALFLDAVVTHNTEKILCDLADALRTQRVLDAASRSLTDGTPKVIFEEPEP